MKKTTTKALPTPAKHDSRICFGINYYLTDAEATAAARAVRARGDAYNGGWFDGMACGRAKEFDYWDSELGVQLFAVTTR